MDLRVCKVLEFDKILAAVATFAQSEGGKAALLAAEPLSSLAECNLLLQQTIEADALLYAHGISPSMAIEDTREQLQLSAKGVVLSMGDLLKIAQGMRIASGVKYAIIHCPESAPLVKGLAQQLFGAETLEGAISQAIISESEMSDNASEELASIRQQIRRGNERLKEKIQSFLSRKEYAPYLQEAIVTKRSDRYVIPVKSDFRGHIRGLIHDQSSSGQTLYIEPIEVVEMNNELKQLAIDEQKEIERILRDFSSRVALIATQLAVNWQVVVDLDVIFARAAYGHSIGGTAPLLNDCGRIDIKEGRHPLIDRKKVVPNTLVLGDAYDILLITGPNTGGKTVTLKMAGLFVLMASCGLFLPCKKGSEISVFEHVFCDIGDEQSIEQSLSTFSSHMGNVVEMVRNVDDRSLVLIDELGAGTDPEEGAALAVQITDYMRAMGAKAVITTHYSRLKEYAYSTNRVENACMDFDLDTYAPLYKLIIGIPGTSNAFEIAARMGLPESIVSLARLGTDTDKASFEKVLLSADQTRRKAEEEREKYSRLNQELQEELRKAKQEQNKLKLQVEKLNANARLEVKRLVDLALGDVNEIVDELKKMLETPTQADYFRATQLRKKLKNITVDEQEESDEPPTVDEAPQVGDLVYVGKFHDVATLTAITKNGEYIIRMGQLKSIVRKNDIRKLARQQKEESVTVPKKQVTLQNAPAKRELYLLGCKVEEALYRVEQFIDDARLAHVEEVKIIHGMGTGALRNAIWEYLNESNVVSFRSGKSNEGGQGVTFVRLR